jgi:hypothetical protein
MSTTNSTYPPLRWRGALTTPTARYHDYAISQDQMNEYGIVLHADAVEVFVIRLGEDQPKLRARFPLSKKLAEVLDELIYPHAEAINRNFWNADREADAALKH